MGRSVVFVGFVAAWLMVPQIETADGISGIYHFECKIQAGRKIIK
jgi:hypothetical protein